MIKRLVGALVGVAVALVVGRVLSRPSYPPVPSSRYGKP